MKIGLPKWSGGKKLACQCRRHKRRSFHPWVGKIPWSRKWQPTLVFLPGKFHGQRSLVGYSAWGQRVWYNWAHTHTQVLNPFWVFLSQVKSPQYFHFFFNLTSCPCHQVSAQILLQVGLHELRLIPQMWADLCRVYKDLIVPGTNLGECSPGLD